MGIKAAIAIVVVVLFLLFLGSALNQINLSGVLNFTDIFNGTAEVSLFNQLAYDFSSWAPYQYRFYIQQFFLYFVLALILAGSGYAIYKAATD